MCFIFQEYLKTIKHRIQTAHGEKAELNRRPPANARNIELLESQSRWEEIFTGIHSSSYLENPTDRGSVVSYTVRGNPKESNMTEGT